MDNQIELILSLIKADLVNSKLIAGLENIGLTSEDFYLDLSIPILKLIGFQDRDDELNTFYLNILTRLIQDNSDNFRLQKNKLAIEFYAELLAEKKFRERQKVSTS